MKRRPSTKSGLGPEPTPPRRLCDFEEEWVGSDKACIEAAVPGAEGRAREEYAAKEAGWESTMQNPCRQHGAEQ